ncbi:MAG TPA: PDZ domain-containing protein [Chitinophagaceae bacterium]|nr:PDZ domain-containing protein [Chitinophagaceae bacterium]
MKRVFRKISVLAVAAILLAPVSLLAQQEEKEKENKDSKDKNDMEVITITRKGDKNDKTTVEINGDKITVNGKPMEDLKDGDITVRRNKIRNYRGGNWSMNGGDGMTFFNGDENHAMLGVTTEKVDKGVEVQDVTKESAAEKIGLKEKDIITKIDDQKVEDPDDLSNAISKHKPGDKVKVTFLRDNKEQTATAELTKWKGVNVFSQGNGFNYNFKMPEMNFNEIMPKIQGIPRVPQGNWNQMFNVIADRPRLGLSIQDTDDGKGVKVIDVDEEGSAEKAGVKKDDLITEIDGKAVNSADEVAKIVRGTKDKNSLMLKIQRGGKTQNIEVKIPRKLKTADL